MQPIAHAGVDIFHCSQRRCDEAEFPDVDGRHGLNFAGWAKKLTGAVTITVGSVGLSGELVAALGGERSEPASLDAVACRLARGKLDLVAVGRALLAVPGWTNKVRAGDSAAITGFGREALARFF